MASWVSVSLSRVSTQELELRLAGPPGWRRSAGPCGSRTAAVTVCPPAVRRAWYVPGTATRLDRVAAPQDHAGNLLAPGQVRSQAKRLRPASVGIFGSLLLLLLRRRPAGSSFSFAASSASRRRLASCLGLAFSFSASAFLGRLALEGADHLAVLGEDLELHLLRLVGRRRLLQVVVDDHAGRRVLADALRPGGVAVASPPASA